MAGTLREQVLSILMDNTKEYRSGEAIAAQLYVSRMAVMKAVNALRASGYTISSHRHLGYRLDDVPDVLDAQRICAYTESHGLQIDVMTFPTIDSTNNEGKRRAHDLTRPLLLVADEQTNGRGRQGHSFYSPDKTGLYMTIVVPTVLPLQTIALCTQMMAVAAARAVESLNGPKLQIKWVNDLYLEEKKVAGILTEAVTDLETQRATAVVCGIGLNLTTASFPDEIHDKAASLGAVKRSELAAAITVCFLELMDQLPDISFWMEDYRNRSLVIGRGLSFVRNGCEYHGVGKEIDDQGGLVVKLDDGNEVTLSSGEVSIMPDFTRL